MKLQAEVASEKAKENSPSWTRSPKSLTIGSELFQDVLESASLLPQDLRQHKALPFPAQGRRNRSCNQQQVQKDFLAS